MLSEREKLFVHRWSEMLINDGTEESFVRGIQDETLLERADVLAMVRKLKLKGQLP